MSEKRLVWYKTATGNEVVRDAIRELSRADKLIVGEDLMVAQLRFPKGAPIVKAIGAGLYEVRSTISGKREFRCIFAYDPSENTLVVVHVFVKKTQKMPLSDMNLAKRRAKEYLAS
jgi:phage-related protein